MSTERTFYTYLHCKPDLTPFYVGKGSDGDRKRSHDFGHRNKYHKSIVAKHGKENIIVLVFKKDSEESAFKSEIRLIKMLRNAGFKLCNFTDGGEGVSGVQAWNKGMTMPAEHRAKLSAAKVGKPNGRKGCIFTVEHRTNLSIAHMGQSRPMSDETKIKIAKSNSGKHLTVEHCANISLGKKGKPWTKARIMAQDKRRKSGA